jgi:hypothetical protein
MYQDHPLPELNSSDFFHIRKVLLLPRSGDGQFQTDFSKWPVRSHKVSAFASLKLFENPAEP